MPKTLSGHSSLSQENDLIIVGGISETGGYHYSASIYKLTCISGNFTWEEMDVKLQTARYRFVADFIPNLEPTTTTTTTPIAATTIAISTITANTTTIPIATTTIDISATTTANTSTTPIATTTIAISATTTNTTATLIATTTIDITATTSTIKANTTTTSIANTTIAISATTTKTTHTKNTSTTSIATTTMAISSTTATTTNNTTTPIASTTIAISTTTKGIGHNSFCTADNLCDENEGDCDYDYECKNDLVCGTNNCPNSPEFGGGDDCCYSAIAISTTTKGIGHDSFCTANNLCDENEGDCDYDYECKNDLVCGTNNCPDSPEFGGGDDCCYSVGCSGIASLIGDNYCDDENNNEECNWDGGDCCGDNVNTEYCDFCDCLEPI